MNCIERPQRIKRPLAMRIDSLRAVGIASSLVRICSSDVHSDERGLLPIQFGGNDQSICPTGMAKRLSTGRQSNGRDPLKGEALLFRHPHFLKNMRGPSNSTKNDGVRVLTRTLKGNLYFKMTTPTEAA